MYQENKEIIANDAELAAQFKKYLLEKIKHDTLKLKADSVLLKDSMRQQDEPTSKLKIENF